ncbi:WXG100 family type VII secretion target [Paenibacillus kribbensis]|uniref:WXG100 family type VII secretion target n=1 Tax=Paenibacillus kribbensis TaxID=172713 RepID=UPI002DBBF4DF|nr:WXG100 family type VII secretion target [Paenibacillus kribbensis]MEC0236365.1 WXG100 family type VII secretion target [Paenibacillus kribbensis]
MTTIKVTPEQLITVSKKFDLAQQTVMKMNSQLSQHISFMERFWEGITKEQFYYRFQTSQKNMADFVTLTDSISKELRQHADKFRLADLMEAGNIDAGCLPPPPNSCAVPIPDTRNAFQKSADSLTELGQDFVAANSERYEKKFDSVWSFLDYMTYGIPKGMYQGYMERAAKQNDSWNDMLNFGTFGVTGMIQGAFNPTNAWSKEHMANLIGTAGLFGGVSSLIKPKIGLKSSVRYKDSGNKNSGLSKSIESDPMSEIQTGGRNELSIDEYFRREAEADEMYDQIRTSDSDVKAIAENSGMKESRVQRIKEHVFINEHRKSSGYGRFHSDYEIAQAWDRLQKGLQTEKDIELLNHELFESRFEGIFKTNYETAHNAAVRSGRPWEIE